MSVTFPPEALQRASAMESTSPSIQNAGSEKTFPRCSTRNLEDSFSNTISRHSTQTFVDEITADLEPAWPADWRAYRALFGGFLLMFNSWGLVNAFGTFQSFYRMHLLVSTDTKLVTLLGATQCFFTLIVSFAMGRLLDAGLHRYLAAAGGAVTTLGMFMLSLTAGDGGLNQGNYVYIWLTQGLCVGLGMACVFVYSSQVVACWFPKQRSLAIGISASGASIGTSPIATRQFQSFPSPDWC